MVKLFLLLLLASCWASVLQPNQTDEVVVNAVIRKNVTLKCSSGDTEITAGIGVLWNRTDLEQQKYVLFHRDGRSDITNQDPRYKDRVALVDSNPKNNLSLVLKKVTPNDSGEYECKVIQPPDMFNVTPIKIIQLNVTEQEMPKSHSKDNKNLHHWEIAAVIILAAVIIRAVVALCVFLFKKSKTWCKPKTETEPSIEMADVLVDKYDYILQQDEIISERGRETIG